MFNHYVRKFEAILYCTSSRLTHLPVGVADVQVDQQWHGGAVGTHPGGVEVAAEGVADQELDRDARVAGLHLQQGGQVQI